MVSTIHIKSIVVILLDSTVLNTISFENAYETSILLCQVQKGERDVLLQVRAAPRHGGGAPRPHAPR